MARETAEDARWSQWMADAQRGDEASYRRLLEALAKVIEAYVWQRLGSVELVEDVVQESLLAIHNARHTYSPDRPFRPWMYAIVRYKVIDTLRRKTAQQHFVNAGSATETEQYPGHAQSIHEGVDAVLEGEQLFKGMKPISRQALVLTKVLGLTVKEAASHLGISETAMKVRMHRAMNELHALMEVSG